MFIFPLPKQNFLCSTPLFQELRCRLDLKQKAILITGAGGGTGGGKGIKLAQLGATLALTDINEASLNNTRNLCTNKDNHYTSAFDIGSTEKCNAFPSLHPLSQNTDALITSSTVPV